MGIQERARRLIEDENAKRAEQALRKQNEENEREEAIGTQIERIREEITTAESLLEQYGASDLLRQMQEAWGGGSIQLSPVLHCKEKVTNLKPGDKNRRNLGRFNFWVQTSPVEALKALETIRGGGSAALSLTWKSIRAGGYSYGRPVGCAEESERRGITVQLVDDHLQIATLAKTAYSELKNAVREIDGITEEMLLTNVSPEDAREWLTTALAKILATLQEQDPCFPYDRIRRKMNKWIKDHQTRYGIPYPGGGFLQYLKIDPNKGK